MAHTIKISGVSDELLSLIENRWRGQHYADRAEYVRDLIRRDIVAKDLPSVPQPSFSESIRSLFGALHEEVGKQGYAVDEIESDVERALTEIRTNRPTKTVRSNQ